VYYITDGTLEIVSVIIITGIYSRIHVCACIQVYTPYRCQWQVCAGVYVIIVCEGKCLRRKVRRRQRSWMLCLLRRVPRLVITSNRWEYTVSTVWVMYISFFRVTVD